MLFKHESQGIRQLKLSTVHLANDCVYSGCGMLVKKIRKHVFKKIPQLDWHQQVLFFITNHHRGALALRQ
jgi:hypothetical protein